MYMCTLAQCMYCANVHNMYICMNLAHTHIHTYIYTHIYINWARLNGMGLSI